MICLRISRKELKKISPEDIVQIEPNRLTAARRASIDAAKKAATRANIDGTGGKTPSVPKL